MYVNATTTTTTFCVYIIGIDCFCGVADFIAEFQGFFWKVSGCIMSIQICYTGLIDLCVRCVLELGCGVGLAGISLCKLCGPSEYFFTDCHAAVLGRLKENIDLNLKGKSCNVLHVEMIASKLYFNGRSWWCTIPTLSLLVWKETSSRMHHLPPWEAWLFLHGYIVKWDGYSACECRAS